MSVLNNYLKAKSSGAKKEIHDVFRSLKNKLQGFNCVKQRENILIKFGTGIGSFVQVPWIALLDKRETTTTREGVYCVYLFCADMSGVYLTLNQGVGASASEAPKKERIIELQNKARKIREKLSWLKEKGFLLDDKISLKATTITGKAYEKATIAYKWYEKNNIPSDNQIESDLEVLLSAYDEYLRIKKSSETSEILHLLYKIAWHPGGYKGGFCGNAEEKACEAFEYIRKNKKVKPCSQTVYHCIDEHEAFADSGWKVTIHPRRVKKLYDLSDGRSLLFLVAPMNVNKSRYRLIGFYKIKKKIIENGEVKVIEADKNFSSKFDLQDENLELDKNRLMKLFNIENWTPRLSYEFISTNAAIKALNYVYEKLKDKEIKDQDINLNAIKSAIESLKQSTPNQKITIYDYMLSQGFFFEESAVSAFYTALKTKGFVILAGLTGTGKTKLPQLFFDLIKSDETKLFVPVRPDWRDSKPLLGYFNPIEGTYEATELLNFILKARSEWQIDGTKQPFFVLFDEMNLARVEYYFADFLSVLESGREENSKLFTKESIILHHEKSKTRDGSDIPSKIALPPNLYFIGTVNLDETTYSFSPKVLDRVFVVEFWKVDLDKYRNQTTKTIDIKSVQNLRETVLEDLSRNGKFLAFSKSEIKSSINLLGNYYDDLICLNNILQKFGLHFGYRVIDEISLFYKNAVESQNKGIIRFESDNQIIDYAVLMKVLPKIHGNRAKVETALYWILVWASDPKKCEEKKKEFQGELGKVRNEFLDVMGKEPEVLLNKVQTTESIKYPKTAEKVARMLFQLYSTGFTSYL